MCFDLRKFRDIALMRYEAAYNKFVLYTVPIKFPKESLTQLSAAERET